MDLNKSGSVEEAIFTNKVNGIKAAFNVADRKIIVSHIGELDQDKVNTISTLPHSTKAGKVNFFFV